MNELEMLNQQRNEQQFNMLRQQLLTKSLTKEARSRLNTVRVAHPDVAAQVEMTLLRLAQEGRIPQIDDAQLKELLNHIQQGTHKEFNIRRK